MPLPIVAVVGRPNVGKSSLFNWLAGRRISIVDPTAGVTRDRVATVIPVGKRYCELVDTGGIGIVDVDNLSSHIEKQIQIAIDEASVIVFLVDIRDGVAPLDEDVAERLRDVGKPVVFVANKADTEKLTHNNMAEFYRLGYGEPVFVSAQQLRGKDELLAAILDKLPRDTGAKPPSAAELKLAIVGRRNVGKSTFINTLAQEERVIVSEIAGTTRDSIDVRFERDGKVFMAIDTAGVRKKQKLASDIEFYSMTRAERSIRRADVVLHLFDPRYRISRVDKQLAEYVLEQNKPVVFVVNKWDLMKDQFPTEKMGDYIRVMFPMLDYVPIAFITATKGRNVLRLLQLSLQMQKQGNHRVSTGDLNRVIRQAFAANAPPVRSNRLPKVYYATQVSTHPPTIVLMTNEPELFDQTYVRYLTKTLRDSFPFSEVALKLVLRAKGQSAGFGAGQAPAASDDDAFDMIADDDKIPGEGEDTEELLTFAADPEPAKPKPQPKKPAKHAGRIVPELLEEMKPAPKPKPKAKPNSSAPPKPKKKKGETKPWDF